MTPTPLGHDVAVIGAGVWGLAGAWSAAAAGARVLLLDDGGTPTAHVAAGMLAPWSEVADDDLLLHAALLAANAAWPSLATRLADASGLDPGFDATGSLAVAARPEHIGHLRRLRATLDRLGRAEQWHAGSALRELEPGLATSVSAGMRLDDEGQVDPRRLLAALRAAVRRAGVEVRVGRATALRRDAGGLVTGLDTDVGQRVRAGRVVLAAGWSCGALDARVPLRPVKGQILTLAPRREGHRPLARIVRTPDVYLVPRPDGRVLVGATTEEAADRVVTAGAVHGLLDEALHTVPELAELAFQEHAAGLRPATPDGLPALGVAADGLVWAAGGYRQGVLLLPLVVAATAALLTGQAPPEGLDRFSPDRFAPVEEGGGSRARDRERRPA